MIQDRKIVKLMMSRAQCSQSDARQKDVWSDVRQRAFNEVTQERKMVRLMKGRELSSKRWRKKRSRSW